ncbi:hypothetical protein QA649_15235 [Bradyrhizobium sp. CB1717]|uniref:hypothetical protein n=1 Tax=Bradyrhizobium sp. CB1717 TaxID=3039154 RepID=UPI0024B058EB|nr:hypothetical protein [Bradyrhizobium sp. CB1717]WFU27509.1 hypothetical protein QA649_15235 [Bradyrhizobium sp. CB1717]
MNGRADWREGGPIKLSFRGAPCVDRIALDVAGRQQNRPPSPLKGTYRRLLHEATAPPERDVVWAVLPDRPGLIRNPLIDTELVPHKFGGFPMDGIIYLVGLIVIIMFILSLFGLR